MDSTIVLRHLHDARLSHYRSNCAVGATDEEVLALYLWNAELASALSEVLGYAEVAIRHAIDTELGIWSKSEVGSDLWIDERDNLPLLKSAFKATRRQLYKAADESRKARSPSHPRSGQTINHDDMVAHVMFGTWGTLLPEKFDSRRVQADGSPVQDLQNLADRRELWRTVLYKAFPKVSLDPRGIGTGNRVRELRRIRNRVSHMDSLLYVDVPLFHNNVLLPLFNSIDHDLRDWAKDHSKVLNVWAQRPR
jgi:hypothetical protein